MSEKPKANGMVAVEDLLRANGRIPSDEVWIHGMWTPRVWWACWRALRTGRKLVRMTHGSLSPIYLTRQSPWKKRLVAPIERFFFARTVRVVVTGAWEEAWCRAWGLEGPFETIDIKTFFDFPPPPTTLGIRPVGRPLRVLYLGRIHPLKGIDILQSAVKELDIELRVESAAFGADKEAAFDWCDCLVLPTLSENFGLVVAEALMHGKPVLTTDGAPAWANQPGVVFVKGYAAASRKEQVALLRQAFEALAGDRSGENR